MNQQDVILNSHARPLIYIRQAARAREASEVEQKKAAGSQRSCQGIAPRAIGSPFAIPLRPLNILLEYRVLI